MSPRALGLTFAAAWTACVVDQIDGDVAAIELSGSLLLTPPLRCLPPAPHEGERLEARRVLPDEAAPPAPECLYQLRRPRGDGPPTAALAPSLRDTNNTNNTNNTHRQRRQP